MHDDTTEFEDVELTPHASFDHMFRALSESLREFFETAPGSRHACRGETLRACITEKVVRWNVSRQYIAELANENYKWTRSWDAEAKDAIDMAAETEDLLEWARTHGFERFREVRDTNARVRAEHRRSWEQADE